MVNQPRNDTRARLLRIAVLPPLKTPRRRGFSMMEVTISTILVGLLLTGSMVTTGSLILRHGLRTQQDRKALLAHDLLTEMSQVSFADPDSTQPGLGPEFGEAGETRIGFDDIDDYDDWQEATVQGKSGQPLAGQDGYQRRVKVQYVSLVQPDKVSPVPTDLKRIAIEVEGPDQQVFSLVRLRGRRGVLEVVPGVESTFVRGVQVRLRADPASPSLYTGTGLLNPVAVGETP